MRQLISVLLVVFTFLAMSNNSFSQNVNVSSTSPVTNVNYATLKLATQAINAGTHGSLAGGNAITVKINGDITETAPDTLRNVTGTTISVYPTTSVSVFANFAGTAAVLTLDNADNVTVDGRLNGSGARSMRIKWEANGSRCFKLVNGSSSNIIRYVDCIGLAYSGTIIDINLGTIALGGNNNNVIENCVTSRGTRGIQSFGAAGADNTNNTIKDCKIYNALQIPINMSIANNGGTLTGNEITYDSVAMLGLANSYAYGIQILGGGNWTVSNNKIYNILKRFYTSGYGIIGILFAPLKPTSAVTSKIDSYNNMISITNDTNVLYSDVIFGMYIQDGNITGSPNDGVAYTCNSYNNTVLVGGDGMALGDLAWAYINDMGTGAAAVPGCTSNDYNNICINRRFNAGTGGQEVGMQIDTSGTSTKFADYNFAISTDPSVGWNGSMNGWLYESIKQFKDTACVFGWHHMTAFKDANFVSNFNLHLAGPVGGDMNGLPNAFAVTDIDGTTRNSTYPYRGCDEGAALKVLTLQACLEGKVNDGEVTVVLRDAGCANKSTSTGYLNVNNNTAKICFGDSISNGTGYTIACQSLNHVETYSASMPSFSSGLMTYDFTSSQSQAYGGNQTAGPPSCFYGGDVTGDSIIDLSDITKIFNDAGVFLGGCRLISDVNSDEFVDLTDLSIAFNNSANFVGLVSPCPEPRPTETTKTKQPKMMTKPLKPIEKKRFNVAMTD